MARFTGNRADAHGAWMPPPPFSNAKKPGKKDHRCKQMPIHACMSRTHGQVIYYIQTIHSIATNGESICLFVVTLLLIVLSKSPVVFLAYTERDTHPPYCPNAALEPLLHQL